MKLLKLSNKIKFHIKVILRIFGVVMIYVSYFTFPSYTFFFSKRKLYSPKKNRWTKNEFKPFLISNKSKKKFKEINLIAKGSSFDLNDIKKFKDPTFLVGFTNTLRIKNNKIVYQHEYGDFRYEGMNRKLKLFQKKNIYYIHTHPVLAVQLHKNDKVLFMKVLKKVQDSKKYFWHGHKKMKKKLKLLNKFKSIQKVKIIENVYKNYSIDKEKEELWAPTGSIVPIIYYLLSVSKKVNIYGWDFYFDKKIKKYNFFSFLKNIYKLEPDTKRSWNHIESCLMNLYFAYILEKREEISLKGNLSELNCQKKFINKFEKVIFK